jgi:hypothetical protein
MMLRKLTDWFFTPEKPPKERYGYLAPADAINIGPAMPGWPSYLRAWHDKKARRIKFEFRNMPGVVTAMDERILADLITGLRILQDQMSRDSFSSH